MADWTNIDDTFVEPGKPVRSADGLALRDNPIAIAEGASGAPRIDGTTSPALRNGGVPNGELGAEKFQTGITESNWVLARTAAASAGAVGAYIFATWSGTGSPETGETVSGSSISPSRADGVTSSFSLSGTWKIMGGDLVSGGANSERTTLFLRIS